MLVWLFIVTSKYIFHNRQRTFSLTILKLWYIWKKWSGKQDTISLNYFEQINFLLFIRKIMES